MSSIKNSQELAKRLIKLYNIPCAEDTEYNIASLIEGLILKSINDYIVVENAKKTAKEGRINAQPVVKTTTLGITKVVSSTRRF